MKKHHIYTILTLLLAISCRQPSPENTLRLYQPLPSLQPIMDQSFFDQVAALGFNSLLLQQSHFSSEQLTQFIPLAHQANLAVVLELIYGPNIEAQMQQWIINHQVDGFVINGTDNLDDTQRRKLRYTVTKYARTLQRSKSHWGTTGYLIGRSQQTNPGEFIKATFGERGSRSSRRGFNSFLHTIGQPLLEQALIPAEDSANQLAIYFSLSALYGKAAIPITMIPSSIAADSQKTALMLQFIASSPRPFVYQAMLAPQDDTILQNNLPTIIQLRSANLALDSGSGHLMRGSGNVYVDLLTSGNSQVLRVFNFDNQPTIFTLSNVRTMVRGRKLVDIQTGNEIIANPQRSFRILLPANSAKLLRVES